MSRINPDGQITRAERLVVVIALCGAVLVHVVVIFGWGRIYQWTQEEQKKERLMVIRRVRDIAPPRESVPAPGRQAAPAPEVMAGGGRKSSPPPPPAPKVKERGPEPPKETELSPEAKRELEGKTPDLTKRSEQGDNSVIVVTDLPAATFIVSGPSEYRGSGTYWIRKGVPPGRYVATFNPVAGFTTPLGQIKDLVAKGQIVFFGKYRRSVELVVASNQPGAQFTIYRPDGRPLDMNRPGRVQIDDLPPGNYTAVFKDLPGFVTPAALTLPLSPEGNLSFYGEYGSITAGRGAGGGRRGSGGAGSGKGDGRGAGRAGAGRGGKAPGSQQGELDRRVQMIVKSYPSSPIEEDYDAIPYPEVIIRKSNFQQGWCQVYLVIEVNDDGEVERVTVERPQAGDRPLFELLIKAVEESVRTWDYDRVKIEVHVDVRFYVE